MIGYYLTEAVDGRRDELTRLAARRRRARLAAPASGRRHRRRPVSALATAWRRGWLREPEPRTPSYRQPSYREPGYLSAVVVNGSYGPAGTPTGCVRA